MVIETMTAALNAVGGWIRPVKINGVFFFNRRQGFKQLTGLRKKYNKWIG